MNRTELNLQMKDFMNMCKKRMDVIKPKEANHLMNRAGKFLSALDKRVLDCEHMMMLAEISIDGSEAKENAVEILTETLVIRGELKHIMWQLQTKRYANFGKAISTKELVYTVKELVEEFGDTISVQSGLLTATRASA